MVGEKNKNLNDKNKIRHTIEHLCCSFMEWRSSANMNGICINWQYIIIIGRISIVIYKIYPDNRQILTVSPSNRHDNKEVLVVFSLWRVYSAAHPTVHTTFPVELEKYEHRSTVHHLKKNNILITIRNYKFIYKYSICVFLKRQ